MMSEMPALFRKAIFLNFNGILHGGTKIVCLERDFFARQGGPENRAPVLCPSVFLFSCLLQLRQSI